MPIAQKKKKEQRYKFYTLAQELGLPFIILDFQASEEILKQRIINRATDKSEPSEADLKVLDSQLCGDKLLVEDEKANTIVVNTESEIRINEIAKSVKNRILA